MQTCFNEGFDHFHITHLYCKHECSSSIFAFNIDVTIRKKHFQDFQVTMDYGCKKQWFSVISQHIRIDSRFENFFKRIRIATVNCFPHYKRVVIWLGNRHDNFSFCIVAYRRVSWGIVRRFFKTFCFNYPLSLSLSLFIKMQNNPAIWLVDGSKYYKQRINFVWWQVITRGYHSSQ